LDQIVLVSLIKLLLVIFKKLLGGLNRICYSLGWLVVFAARFIYLFLMTLARPVAKSLNYLSRRFYYNVSVKLPHHFVLAYRAMQSALLAAGLLLLRFFKSLAIAKQKMAVPAELTKTDFYPERDLEIERAAPDAEKSISYLRPALVFAGVLLLIILPVKAFTYYKDIDRVRGKVLGVSESGLADLISGSQAAADLDFGQANKSFSKAADNFLNAQNQLEQINDLLFTLASLAPNKDLQLAGASKHLVRAGELSAAAGENLSRLAGNLFNYETDDPRGILANLTSWGHKALANLTDLTNELARIDSDISPANYQRQFILLKQKTAQLARGFGQFIGIIDNLKIFLGDKTFKRYLLVFQNNSELRASGGFIGSFALVDFLNGKIKNLEVPAGGSYDTEAGLLKKIKSPEPLHLVRPDWHFWDANWWPDWPTSARKLAWFYENSNGPTVDGVISFTPAVVERILKVIGPMDLKKQYGAIVDADNFWQIAQELAEQKPNVTKQPKKIIGDLMNKIIEELPRRLDKNNFFSLLTALENSFNDKNILFYFTDSELQAKVEELGWAGRLEETAGDYLGVINTNIAGGKSDREIKQEVNHRAEIQPDGTIIDNLIIRRTHQAIKRQPFVGVRNVDWLRIYVPLGSKLISVSGFKPVDKIFFKEVDPNWPDDPEVAAAEAFALTDQASATKIYNELGKTVFANWSQVDPGESVEINIKYQLPFKLTEKKSKSERELIDRLMAGAEAIMNQERKNLYSYSLLAQKQPGMDSSIIISELKLSDNFKPIWRFPADLKQRQNGWLVSENFAQDKLWAVLVEE
jgi:hypothetical protein